MRLSIVTLVLSCMSLYACSETVDSSDVDTAGIYADLSATADGSGSTVASAALRVGGELSNTYLDLTEYDSLTVSVGTQVYGLQRRTAFGAVWYEASVEEDAEGTRFKFSFLRTSPHEEGECGKSSAPDSNAALPAPFTLTGPSPDASFSRENDAITITWSNAGEADNMSWLVEGPCILLAAGAIDDDDGSATIPAGSLSALPGMEDDTCDVTLEVERRRDGDLDSNYGEGGVIFARHVRRVSLSSTP